MRIQIRASGVQIKRWVQTRFGSIASDRVSKLRAQTRNSSLHVKETLNIGRKNEGALHYSLYLVSSWANFLHKMVGNFSPSLGTATYMSRKDEGTTHGFLENAAVKGWWFAAWRCWNVYCSTSGSWCRECACVLSLCVFCAYLSLWGTRLHVTFSVALSAKLAVLAITLSELSVILYYVLMFGVSTSMALGRNALTFRQPASVYSTWNVLYTRLVVCYCEE